MSYISKSLTTAPNALASRDKRISICLAAGGFSFAELTSDGKLLTFGEAEGAHALTMTGIMADIKAYFASVGIKPLGYARMELVVMSDNSTWVPDELYSSLSNRRYLLLQGGAGEGIATYHSEPLQSTAIFSANEQVITAFKVALPGVNIIHQHGKLSQLSARFSAAPTIVAHLRRGRIDMAAFSEGQYVFGNTFSFNGKNEAVYHLVEVMKSYGLESDQTELQLCGEVDRTFYTASRPYFPHVELFCVIDNDSQAAEFQMFPSYRHALLLI